MREWGVRFLTLVPNTNLTENKARTEEYTLVRKNAFFLNFLNQRIRKPLKFSQLLSFLFWSINPNPMPLNFFTRSLVQYCSSHCCSYSCSLLLSLQWPTPKSQSQSLQRTTTRESEWRSIQYFHLQSISHMTSSNPCSVSYQLEMRFRWHAMLTLGSWDHGAKIESSSSEETLHGDTQQRISSLLWITSSNVTTVLRSSLFSYI